jgi:hypothetical protein
MILQGLENSCKMLFLGLARTNVLHDELSKALKNYAKKLGLGNGNWPNKKVHCIDTVNRRKKTKDLWSFLIFFLFVDANISTLQEERSFKLT